LEKHKGKIHRCKISENFCHNIAVIGHLVWDRIIQVDGSRVEDFGGIAYNLAAIGAMVNVIGSPVNLTRVLPVCNVGFDLFDMARTFFSRFSAIDFSLVRKISRKNIFHELKYDTKGYRREYNTGSMPKIRPSLFKDCSRIDVALVNHIGGGEFPPRYLRWLKDKFDPLIYMDYHSLALGRSLANRKNHKLKRYFRYNPHWREYVGLADIVQMNHIELKSIFPETIDETESVIQSAKKVHDAGPDIIIITREHKDLVLIYGSNINPRIYAIPVYPVEKLVEPTGCGDAFAAGFILSYCRSNDVLRACKEGLYIAHKKAGFSGMAGFLKLIK
jgi:sugar/nucleoside kinase (ribokinase family)